jgi:AcrR family transcriptional regulator
VPRSRTAILETVEELLRVRRLDELTVAEIVEAAGVSRATFYTHFDSKFSVVAALVRDIVNGVYENWRRWFEGDEPADEPTLRRYTDESVRRWHDHPALLAATVEGWHTDPEIHDLWQRTLDNFSAALAARIERDRAAGRQPADDMDALALATGLCWMAERALYIAASSPESVLGSEEALATTWAAIWARAMRPGPSGG